MHFGILQDLFSDPRTTLMVLLLALPGRLLAFSAHEAAHGWVAERCGDPTARNMGRVTLNPVRHIDPLGILCMLVLGIGWAKPVPVDPRNFRHQRRDDLLVSLAGITMNLILFLLGGIVMYVILGFAITALPAWDGTQSVAQVVYNGTKALVTDGSAYDMASVVRYGYSLSDLLITPAYGRLAGYLYQMLVYFVLTNISLAVFNLIPLPPLDGYHVLNDLILRRSLFATQQVQRICSGIMLLALWTGLLGKLLSFIIYDGVMEGIGALAVLIFRALGLA